MASVNTHTIIGNLGRDPEVRTLPDGKKVANFSVACTDSWKDKDTGEKKEKTEWINVSLFGGTADVAEKYLHKGSKVCVIGKVRTRKWTDKDGKDRYTTETVVEGYAGKMVLLDKPQVGTAQPDREPMPEEEADRIPF